jgi:hypothetical protein
MIKPTGRLTDRPTCLREEPSCAGPISALRSRRTIRPPDPASTRSLSPSLPRLPISQNVPNDTANKGKLLIYHHATISLKYGGAKNCTTQHGTHGYGEERHKYRPRGRHRQPKQVPDGHYGKAGEKTYENGAECVHICPISPRSPKLRELGFAIHDHFTFNSNRTRRYRIHPLWRTRLSH